MDGTRDPVKGTHCYVFTKRCCTQISPRSCLIFETIYADFSSVASVPVVIETRLVMTEPLIMPRLKFLAPGDATASTVQPFCDIELSLTCVPTSRMVHERDV